MNVEVENYAVDNPQTGEKGETFKLKITGVENLEFPSRSAAERTARAIRKAVRETAE